MPGRTLPSFSRSEVESHNSAKSCYVTYGSNVYDVTDFINDHPGGGDLILEYAGRDVAEIMKDVPSHEHTEAAYDILESCHIGFLSEVSCNGAANGATKGPKQQNGKPIVHENGGPVYATTGMSSEADLSVDTDVVADYMKHKFLDLSKPLFPQLWFGGFSKEFYLEQVHRPRHYKGGDSAPLFGNFLEPLSKTPWWVVPTVWLPCVAYGTAVGVSGLPNGFVGLGYFVFGICFWTLVEYMLHRCLFHVDKYVPFGQSFNRHNANQKADIFLITESGCRCISSSMVSIIISRWIGTVS